VLEGPLEKTVVPSESSRRCLLPHHDGGRSSFLTPSTLQAQWWRPEWRGLVADPPAQKTFQGFLVVAPGPDGAHTGFYPWVALLSGAFEFQTGETANPTTLPSWAGENIRATLALSENRTQYLSLAGALGSRREAHALQPVHSAHDRLGPLAAAHLRADPEPPGCDCLQPGDRFWCSGLRETTGLTWSGLRRRRETQVRAMRHDLVLGHNLAAVHAGFGGGAGRTLLPLCVTVDRPRGTEFERWLTRLWDEAFALQHPL
jgi:hypothetical protein